MDIFAKRIIILEIYPPNNGEIKDIRMCVIKNYKKSLLKLENLEKL